MNVVDIEKKLVTLSNLINDTGATALTIKEIWQRQKEIAENFKAAQFETAEAKDAATEKFQQLTTQLKERENQEEAENLKFTEEAEKLVAVIEELYAKQTSESQLEKNDFQELRKLSNQVFEYFKVQRWSTKERRTSAWDRYATIRNAVKEKEDELYAKVREDKSRQISQSLEIAEKLSVVVDACHPTVPIEELLNLVNRFNQFLTEAGLTENNSVWHLIEKPEDIKYSLRSRTETLNDVRTFINNYKEYITREHKGQIFANIDALKGDLNKAWENLKEEQQKRQEEWEIKKKERDEKRVEWVKNQQNFLVMLEKRLENQLAYREKQENYAKGQKDTIGRFESRIEQQKGYIGKLQEQLLDLEKKHATAWTETFKLKVEEWMKEKNEKIELVLKDIEVMKEKIADINKNIEEMPNRIKELDTSIEEIRTKIEEVSQKLANDNTVTETNQANETPTATEDNITKVAEEKLVDEIAVTEVAPIIESENITESTIAEETNSVVE